MTSPEGFRFKTSIMVRFFDVDMMGHANNAIYFSYMEQGRILYFDDILRIDRRSNEVSVILADAACSYKAPLFYKDMVDVWVRVAKLGNKSFAQEYRLLRQSDELLVATGQTVTVAYSYAEERSVPLPDAWRERITAYEPALPNG